MKRSPTEKLLAVHVDGEEREICGAVTDGNGNICRVVTVRETATGPIYQGMAWPLDRCPFRSAFRGGGE